MSAPRSCSSSSNQLCVSSRSRSPCSTVRRWRGAPWSRLTLVTLASCLVGGADTSSSPGLASSARCKSKPQMSRTFSTATSERSQRRSGATWLMRRRRASTRVDLVEKQTVGEGHLRHGLVDDALGLLLVQVALDVLGVDQGDDAWATMLSLGLGLGLGFGLDERHDAVEAREGLDGLVHQEGLGHLVRVRARVGVKIRVWRLGKGRMSGLGLGTGLEFGLGHGSGVGHASRLDDDGI
eukprot:scaffold98510_cov63-Phaeocystis_antarctica.AAC.4